MQRMPGQYNATVSSVSPDAAPSLTYGGGGLQDHRMAYNKFNALGNGVAAMIVGWASDGSTVVLDQALATAPAATTGGIVPAAFPATGVAMTLTAATTLTNGVLLTPAAFTTMPFMTVIPANTVVVQSQMAYLKLGIRDITAFYDPTNSCARGISITGVASGSGGVFTIKGFDVYGQPMTENITLTAGATTVAGKKAWKWIASVTPAFTDAHNVTVDINTLIGIPLAVDSAAYVTQFIAGTGYAASPTVVAADATTPATAITGDVRGTITIAAPGGNRVVVTAAPSSVRLTNAVLSTGLFGVVNF